MPHSKHKNNRNMEHWVTRVLVEGDQSTSPCPMYKVGVQIKRAYEGSLHNGGLDDYWREEGIGTTAIMVNLNSGRIMISFDEDTTQYVLLMETVNGLLCRYYWTLRTLWDNAIDEWCWIEE